MASFVESFWGERNNGFDVLYHNMKHGHLSTKDLADFIRERATIEEVYSRSMTKLAKSASNYTQLGTFAPVWDVFKISTEKVASCHLELVRKLQELIKEVQKYGDEQIKAHKKTKEEVSGTLEAVQNIQSIIQALQKSKENYNAKCVEQERLKKEGATQREVDKAAVKAKKATDTYKLYVEKYAAAKSDFEKKMTETAQSLTAYTGMSQSSGFKRCTSCKEHILLSDGHSQCIRCLGEQYISQKCPHCAKLKSRAWKDRPPI